MYKIFNVMFSLSNKGECFQVFIEGWEYSGIEENQPI